MAIYKHVSSKEIIRKVFRDPYFMEMSGLRKLDKDGAMSMVSAGTISYWIEHIGNGKGISELTLYNYHTKTGRIKCSFSEFTRKHNRNHKSERSVIFKDYSTKTLALVFNNMCEMVDYQDYVPESFPFSEIMSGFNMLKIFGYIDNEAEFCRDFHKVLRKLEKGKKIVK